MHGFSSVKLKFFALIFRCSAPCWPFQNYPTNILVLCTLFFPATEWRNICSQITHGISIRCRAPKYYRLKQFSDKKNAKNTILINF